MYARAIVLCIFPDIYQLVAKCRHDAPANQYSVKSVSYVDIARLPWDVRPNRRKFRGFEYSRARKRLSWCSNGQRGGTAFRIAVNRVETIEQQRIMTRELFERLAQPEEMAA